MAGCQIDDKNLPESIITAKPGPPLRHDELKH